MARPRCPSFTWRAPANEIASGRRLGAEGGGPAYRDRSRASRASDAVRLCATYYVPIRERCRNSQHQRIPRDDVQRSVRSRCAGTHRYGRESKNLTGSLRLRGWRLGFRGIHVAQDPGPALRLVFYIAGKIVGTSAEGVQALRLQVLEHVGVFQGFVGRFGNLVDDWLRRSRGTQNPETKPGCITWPRAVRT